MSRRFSVAAALLTLAMAPVAAQQPAAAPAAKADKAEAVRAIPTTPSSTTATYGDWVVRCFRGDDAAAGARLCEVVQVLRLKGQDAAVVAQIAFSRPQKAAGWRMTVVLPNDVSFPSVVRVAAGETEASLADLAWRHCLPAGCLADGEVSAAALTRLRAAAATAALAATTAAGKEVRLPVSLVGLSQALDAIARD